MLYTSDALQLVACLLCVILAMILLDFRHAINLQNHVLGHAHDTATHLINLHHEPNHFDALLKHFDPYCSYGNHFKHEMILLLQVVTLLVGGSMALNGQVNPEQLTTFVLYVEFVTAASLSVCDQWGPLMEAIGASERVMYYLDKPPAPQIAAGRKLPSWSGKV